MARLRRVNASLGLMLENVSDRLCERGMPHHKAQDKRPEKRIRMTEEAGELAIPFTSGLLIGIGETLAERVDTLLTIRRIHAAHGHVQEIIVQNFRARPGIVMEDSPEPNEDEVVQAIALARLILPDDVGVQAPPNLNPVSIERLIGAGLDDFGGISPVTPDFINPKHPWPHLDSLESRVASLGFRLRPRLPVYDRFVRRGGFLDDGLVPHVAAAAERLRSVERVGDLSRAAAPVANVAVVQKEASP
jgi:7,8-didemethyl-8-hydroxy-5-deazariboflavin synthase CofG subunit